MVWSTHHTMLGMVSQSKTTMAASLRKVLVIVGTTGAGKTKLSVDLAKAVNGEIINSDAMQVRAPAELYCDLWLLTNG